MTRKTIASFRITMPALNDALSRMPLTKIIVISRAMTTAGKSNQAPVSMSFPLTGS